MRDQIAWLDEATHVLNNVAEGKTAPSDAADRIKELGREAIEIGERKQALSSDATPQELQATTNEYAEQVGQSLQNYLQAVERVTKSGKMTGELTSALENIDSP